MALSFIEDFRAAYESRDPNRIRPLLADDVVLHTSAAGRPVQGPDAVIMVLEMLVDVFEGLTYVAEYSNAHGVVLVSTGSIGGKRSDGIQVVTVDEEGKIAEFKDFVRPLSALSALSEAAARRWGLST